jgi:hypothetical protein
MDGGLKHLPDYLFYKITEAVHVLLRSTVSRQPIPQPISLNLCLNL